MAIYTVCGQVPCSDVHMMAIVVWGGVLGSGFARYVLLVSQSPHPIIVYSVANYRPHLSHFWANAIVISRMEFNVS